MSGTAPALASAARPEPRADSGRRRRTALLMFPSVITSLLIVVYIALTLQSAVRAYVGGESLWSKSQKLAVQHLFHYALSGDTADWLSYERSLSVPRAGRAARLEMLRPDARLDSAARALIAGGNHPDDAMNMARLFHYFGWVSSLRQATEIWAAGDDELAILHGHALALRGAIARGENADSLTARRLIEQIRETDRRLTLLEAKFSLTIADGARWMGRLVLAAVLAVSVVLVWVGSAAAHRLLTREREAADLERRRGEEFRALAENSPDAIARYGPDLRYVYVNPTIVRARGKPAEQIVGRTHDEVGFSPEFVAVWDAALSEVFATGRERQIEFDFDSPDGPRTFHCRLAPEHAADGTTESVLAVGRDVSQLKRSELALRESEAQLRQAQKMEAVGRLAGGVAHDFNNILMVIGGNLDLMKLALPPNAPAPVELTEAKDAVERATALTRQLLSFSRRQVAQPRVLQLNALVAGMGAMLSRLIGEDIQLVTSFAPSLPLVEADPAQLEQVIVNLVVNARDAMPHGGRLLIRTESVPLGRSAPPGVVSAPAALFEVRDTGIGMDANVRSRIFEPFFTTKMPGKGTGLGLSTVYGIVTSSGGRVEVDSAPGAGTRVRVYLPATERLEETASMTPEEGAPTGSETVLLVEDEVAVRQITVRALERQGYAVIEAGNGAEALALIDRGTRPDLLLTDIVMPAIGGRELVGELARRGLRLPVIYMSGYTDDATPLEGTSGERATLLLKPFGAGVLATAMRTALDCGLVGAEESAIGR